MPDAAPTPTAAAEKPRIIAIVNCYSPDGANIGQATIRADGEVAFHNDESLLKPVLAALRSVDMRRFGNNARKR